MPRYPSDMSDDEWAVIEPTRPALAWRLGKGGRPGGYCRRDIVDAIRYLVKEGVQWRAAPCDFPHFLWNAPSSQSTESMFGGNPRIFGPRPESEHGQEFPIH
jgi:transposase